MHKRLTVCNGCSRFMHRQKWPHRFRISDMGLVFRDVKRQSPSVKIEPEKWLGHLRRAAVPGGPLNRKIRICATEAAVLSIGIHLLLIFCAGSMVIWRVTREKEAAFKSENIERPKPEEDRAAQLPVKIDEFCESQTDITIGLPLS